MEKNQTMWIKGHPEVIDELYKRVDSTFIRPELDMTHSEFLQCVKRGIIIQVDRTERNRIWAMPKKVRIWIKDKKKEIT